MASLEKYIHVWADKDSVHYEEVEPCEDCISRQAVLDAFGLSEKTRKYGGDHSGYDTVMLYEIQDVVEDLPSVTPAQSVIEDIKAEIRQWYWQADKQELAKDPCVVDAMVDLFIRTINKHISGKDGDDE